MKIISLIVFAICGNYLFSQEVPELLSRIKYETSIISTDEGDFTAWIVEDDDAKELHRQVKRLERVDVDKSDDFLVFTIYSDGSYEYVVAKQKAKHRKMKFFRITVYSI